MCEYEWWNLAIQIVAAILTMAIIALAIWGDSVRHKIIGPKLNVSLFDDCAIQTTLENGLKGYYYKLLIANQRRWATATNARVQIRKVYVSTTGEDYHNVSFSGPLQLTWQWTKPEYRTIGPDEICTFLHFNEGDNPTISTYFNSNNFDPVIKGREHTILEVVAVADNTDSDITYVKIFWDGIWSPDVQEMKRHLEISIVTKPKVA
ncbi:MAG: hypothetical protein HQ556_08475 [Candidatus Marinimicrobia bacterium]|nr:hypothetical protein [Candidatus Neomarinimicrobiota bacterium]